MTESTANGLRKPFYLFKTLEEELTTSSEFWRSRAPEERLAYLEHLRVLQYGEEVINARKVRCYGWRKSIKDEHDPKNVVYF